MFCLALEEIEELTIYGDEFNTEHQRFEVVLVPCNYVHSRWGFTEDSVSKECVSDLNA